MANLISEQEALELIAEFENARLRVEELSSQGGGSQRKEVTDADTQLQLSAAALYRGLTGNTPSPEAIHQLLSTE